MWHKSWHVRGKGPTTWRPSARTRTHLPTPAASRVILPQSPWLMRLRASTRLERYPQHGRDALHGCQPSTRRARNDPRIVALPIYMENVLKSYVLTLVYPSAASPGDPVACVARYHALHHSARAERLRACQRRGCGQHRQGNPVPGWHRPRRCGGGRRGMARAQAPGACIARVPTAHAPALPRRMAWTCRTCE